MTRIHILIGALSIAILSVPASANVIPPSGLAPGQQYQLIFDSVDTFDATSPNISDYNAFVNAEANIGTLYGLPAGLTWRAVVSTSEVNARDNAPSAGLPVYNTHGDLVAATSIYDGALLAPINYVQFGVPFDVRNASVWTGSDQFGVGFPGLTLGGPGSEAVTAYAGASDLYWLTNGANTYLTTEYGIYALSSPITYVPEPGMISLAASALVALGALRVFQRRRRAWLTCRPFRSLRC